MEATNTSGATNKKIHTVNVVIFCGLLLMGGIASLAMKKPTVSIMENRKLTPFPNYSDSSFWKGTYFKQIDEYYADNFPGRDKWISFSDKFKNSIGFNSSEIKIYDPANDAEANEKTDTAKTETVHDGPLPDDGATVLCARASLVIESKRITTS